MDGVRIPRAGEVEWILPEGRLPYWRGRVGGVEYDRAGRPVRPALGSVPAAR